MGSGHWSDDAFRSVSSTRSTKPDHDVFVSRALSADMDPLNVTVRESRDSIDHPASNAILVAFDVTGSMGQIPAYFAREALGLLMRELLDKKPAPDPQLCVAAVGDSYCDRFPIQVGQFESDNRVDEWLTKIVLEGGGGGQDMESYGLAHYFAGHFTSLDCVEKRGTKGLLFTIGDEKPHPVLPREHVKRLFPGETPEKDVTLQEAIASASRLYDCFHIVVASRSYETSVNVPTWRNYLGERVLVLEDYKALPELILTTVALTRGMSIDAATKGFGKAATELVLRSGVANLPATVGGPSGIVTI